MSAAEANRLLHLLLDRIEARPLEDRARMVTVHLPDEHGSGEASQILAEFLQAAERIGAVELLRGKGETRHLLRSIRLLDAGTLYRHLGRRPAAELAAEAAATLRDAFRSSARLEIVETIAELEEGWRRVRVPYGLRLGDPESSGFLVALGAVLATAPGERADLRTFSSRVAMDSKLVERQVPRILDWMVSHGRLPPDLDPNEARAALGLEKFAHPVLVAGQVMLHGMPVGNLNYIGIAPDDIQALEVTRNARALLTIENFASFNRHVTEAMTGREVVLYTGGFPSRAALRAMRRLVSMVGGAAWHWGDIDGGGLRIAHHLAREVAPRLRLHLMTPELAIMRGQPCAAEAAIGDAATAELTALSVFLASPKARRLEQEVLDPVKLPDDARP